jgi:hypothetical protein
VQTPASAYLDDPHVTWASEGWPPDVPALIRDPSGDPDNNRVVLARPAGGFEVRGATNDDSALCQGPFGSLDEAIGAAVAAVA